jgi:hypothetical protein
MSRVSRQGLVHCQVRPVEPPAGSSGGSLGRFGFLSTPRHPLLAVIAPQCVHGVRHFRRPAELEVDEFGVVGCLDREVNGRRLPGNRIALPRASLN